MREVTIRHLGLIEDYTFEQRYIEGLLGRRFEDLNTSKNYDEREQAYSYMQQYARKHDHKIFLFGYQSIGGSERPLSEQQDQNYDARTVHIREQNRPGTAFNTQNVRRLFIDGDGSYNSGPLVVQDKQQPCIVSGVFYEELDPEVNSVEELNEKFKLVRTISEKTGYSVLRGYKQIGLSVPTEDLAQEDAEMQDAAQDDQAAGEG